MIKNTLIAFLFVILLSGCDRPPITTEAGGFLLPPELSDCKIFRLNNGNNFNLYITRCPNSTTSTTTGEKYPVTGMIVSE